MRIFFYTSQIAFGGAERVMSILANRFAESGNQVMFFLGDEHEIAYSLNKKILVEYHHNKVRIYNPISILREVRMGRDAMNLFNPDVVITFFSQMAIFARMAIGRKKISLIYSQRNDPQQDKGHARFTDALATCFADGIVFQSEAVRALYNERVRKKSVVITNPFSANNFPRYNMNEADETIISVGRLSPQKNQLMLIEAFGMLKDAYPNLTLRIFGRGPLKEVLEERIIRDGLSGRVFLMGPTKHIWEEMSKARLFVLSSDYEGIPNVLIEAMCMGMPCISTDFSPQGAVGELIINGENGVVVPCGNAEQMAEKIKELLGDRKKSAEIGEKASHLIEKVNEGIVFKQWENLCIKLSERIY